MSTATKKATELEQAISLYEEGRRKVQQQLVDAPESDGLESVWNEYNVKRKNLQEELLSVQQTEAEPEPTLLDWLSGKFEDGKKAPSPEIYALDELYKLKEMFRNVYDPKIVPQRDYYPNPTFEEFKKTLLKYTRNLGTIRDSNFVIPSASVFKPWERYLKNLQVVRNKSLNNDQKNQIVDERQKTIQNLVEDKLTVQTTKTLLGMMQKPDAVNFNLVRVANRTFASWREFIINNLSPKKTTDTSSEQDQEAVLEYRDNILIAGIGNIVTHVANLHLWKTYVPRVIDVLFDDTKQKKKTIIGDAVNLVTDILRSVADIELVETLPATLCGKEVRDEFLNCVFCGLLRTLLREAVLHPDLGKKEKKDGPNPFLNESDSNQQQQASLVWKSITLLQRMSYHHISEFDTVKQDFEEFYQAVTGKVVNKSIFENVVQPVLTQNANLLKTHFSTKKNESDVIFGTENLSDIISHKVVKDQRDDDLRQYLLMIVCGRKYFLPVLLEDRVFDENRNSSPKWEVLVSTLEKFTNDYLTAAANQQPIELEVTKSIDFLGTYLSSMFSDLATVQLNDVLGDVEESQWSRYQKCLTQLGKKSMSLNDERSLANYDDGINQYFDSNFDQNYSPQK